MDWNEVDRFARSIIKKAGNKIKQSFTQSIYVETKSNVNDLVTNIDREIEQFFIREIQLKYPTHLVLGEEGYGDEIVSLDRVTWIVDPIDGTSNFVHQQRNFAISIGIFDREVGMLGYIYDVTRDELYAAQKGKGAYLNDERLPKLNGSRVDEAMIGINARWVADNSYVNHGKIQSLVKECRGTRSYGSAAIEIAYVISGKLDAYISMQLSPWDIAAGIVLAKEVGVMTTDLRGKSPSMLGPCSFIIARKQLHDQLLHDYIELKK